ncbi:zinc-binding dehydrogenase [Nakamurella flavida]|uniref:Zinc-binding dehydrogenase n=1 Tax=Nakamurella flavida TaxID=363630 RepID=A0A939C220_9ACTN|nr:zinc-binding dehydrogenase [Nakamurella flavida]MBM9476055.1 zinc-binding dehydrogenase [Nakamurella flavida]MDP9777202.1 S-(hydroxymethyl)glutathione dehydrogenase/alcohol dehydrogenase [Nakamurella flavida]
MTTSTGTRSTDTSMLAAVLEAPDRPLELLRIPRPVPRQGEALVAVTACGVCHTDLHVMRGEVAFPTPAVLGHEISGTVAELGPDTPTGELTVGREVVGAFIMPCGTCPACLRGRDDMCGPFFAMNRLNGTLYDGQTRLHRADGRPLAMYSMAGFAEYAVVPVTALTPVPAGLDLESAAILGCAGMTAYGAVHNAARLQAGESVAVVAVGGVGSSIVQLARAAGAATVIAVDVGADKLAAAGRLGADHLVDSRTVDPVAAVRELTGGRGADVVFEALGLPQTFQQAVGMVADGGRMVAVGIGSGAAAASIPITHLVRRGLQVIGSFGARTRVDLPAVVASTTAGSLSLPETVTRRYPLTAVNEAFADLAAGRIQGRAVITMAGLP